MTSKIPFLPDEKNHEATRLLPYVMAIMVYLSALALMGSMLLHNGFDNWTASLTNRLTIQITAADADRRELLTKQASERLRKTPGITSVRRLNEVEIEQLLEPWLGRGNVTGDLPVPTMLDVTVNPQLSLNMDALRAMLADLSDTIHLDDHQQWLGRFLRLMDMVEYTALGILLLLVMATISIVIFGTKAAMAENRETIAIMHHLGAQDALIARAFRDRFMKYGLKGGVIGLALAFITLISLIYLSRNLASGMVNLPEFPVKEIAALVLVPLIAAFISLTTARLTVMGELRRMV